MSSMAFFDATESIKAREVMQTYLVGALKGLQGAIANFSPQKADAIIAASISLIYGAQNWYVRRMKFCSEQLANGGF
jgi:hypothetical protein